jgi:uncharacterized protein YdeI (BOF family)
MVRTTGRRLVAAGFVLKKKECVVMSLSRVARLVGVAGGVSGLLAVADFAAARQGEPPSQKVAEAPASAASGTIVSVRRGDSVRLSGEVVRVLDRDEFRLSDGTASIPVRISWTGPAPVAVGDRVHVDGLVVDQMTFGLSRPEVIARSIRLPGGATVQFDAPQPARVQPSLNDVSTQAFPIGRLTRGQSATISGRVTGIIDVDEFRVEDASGSVRVYVGWQNRVGVRVGDTVTVVGSLDDDPWPIPAEFYASAVTLADGRVVDLGGGSLPQGNYLPAEIQSATPTVISRIAEVRPYDTVLLRGTVEFVTDEDEFRLRDDSGSIGVYIGWRNAMPVAAGDVISVVGLVDADGPGGFVREIYAHEITTADGKRVDLQPRPQMSGQQATTDQPAGVQPSPVANTAVTPIRDVRRGQAVKLQGQVQRLRDSDEFVLRDDTGTITIYIGWRNRMPVTVGQRVTVIGTADDDVIPGSRPEIYASHVVLEDGRTVGLIRGGRDE